MHENNIETCSACGVKIEGGDKVLFSVGAPGTRSRLWARVCQYAKKPGCINADTNAIGEIQPSDYYGDLEDGPQVLPKAQPQPLAAVVSGIRESLDDL